MFFVCEVGSKFMPYCSVQLFCTEGLHDDVTEQKKQSTRGLGRAKTKKGSNSDLHDDVTEQKKQSTRGLDHASATKTKEGSNSDLHDDVTEQKKQSTRGLGRASATKTKNVHVDVIEPKGTRGLGRVAATSMFLTIHHQIHLIMMCLVPQCVMRTGCMPIHNTRSSAASSTL
ncbi:uncharacterized protein LOC135345712 isoform X3 [Halichondria panicea]|uniref:uncharacterized protein LOC135345712 isoform X3 n=1 Tax=Halichondria panicea TaxID=6063 RepID=UPI00312B643E